MPARTGMRSFGRIRKIAVWANIRRVTSAQISQTHYAEHTFTAKIDAEAWLSSGAIQPSRRFRVGSHRKARERSQRRTGRRSV